MLDGIKRELKHIDEGFDAVFDYDSEHYIITHNNNYFTKRKYGTLDRDFFFELRKTVYQNKNGTIFDEIDKHNAKIEKQKEKQIEDMAYDMAKNIQKPLVKEFYGA